MLLFRFVLVALLTVVPAALPAPAQQVDASATGGPTSLDAPWRIHFGDDPAFAQPGFDDSNWTPHRIDEDWASAGRKGRVVHVGRASALHSVLYVQDHFGRHAANGRCVSGATVTVARWLIALSRVRTSTGRCLSGGANRHRRKTPCSDSRPRGGILPGAVLFLTLRLGQIPAAVPLFQFQLVQALEVLCWRLLSRARLGIVSDRKLTAHVKAAG